MTTTTEPGLYEALDAVDPAELAGLSRTIGETLAKHPRWMRDRHGAVICAGQGCTWEKPEGKSIQDRWNRHLTWAVSAAVRAWYVQA